nr:MAG TPA: hypothetical protein [Caudoviricetes sp.]
MITKDKQLPQIVHLSFYYITKIERMQIFFNLFLKFCKRKLVFG